MTLANGAPVISGGTTADVESNKSQSLTDGQLRALEASHLQVYRGCKWGHAAFEPVRVENEVLSAEVLSLHQQMGRA